MAAFTTDLPAGFLRAAYLPVHARGQLTQTSVRQPPKNHQRFPLTPRAASVSTGGQRCRRMPNAVARLSLLLAGLPGVGMGTGWAQSALPAGPTNLLWTEASVEGKIAGRFGYDLDVQYRRQADARTLPGGDYYNLIKYPSELIGRPFISYAVDSALTVSLSPLGWYGQWVPATSGLLFTPELRVVPQLNYRHSLGPLRLQHRGRYEFRWRGEPTPVPEGNDLDEGHQFRAANQAGRIRYRLQAAWPPPAVVPARRHLLRRAVRERGRARGPGQPLGPEPRLSGPGIRAAGQHHPGNRLPAAAVLCRGR